MGTNVGGGWLKGEDSEIGSEAREAPAWTPKPAKPDKPTEEIIVDVLEFSHQSFVSFLEFTIAWLDDKSGDYRCSFSAIVNILQFLCACCFGVLLNIIVSSFLDSKNLHNVYHSYQ